jgi:anhydro-N-acetylmuramic acid kinase
MKTVIGLMSGTSFDGIDIALIQTDGKETVEYGPSSEVKYSSDDRSVIQKALGKSDREDESVLKAEKLLTQRHIEAINKFLEEHGITPDEVDLIGFHGQTIFHEPENEITIQIGDGERLATETGIDVVYNVRLNDVKHGGQGAPLAPIYHRLLAHKHDLELPIAFLNIGGVANITFITEKEDNLIGFDTGPGNALIDDKMQKLFGEPFDRNGQKAKKGKIDKASLRQLLENSYFNKPPPKSLDRDNFSSNPVDNLPPLDQIATLTEFSARTIAESIKHHLPDKPLKIVVSGGGAHNSHMLDRIEINTGINVVRADEIDIIGDGVEAQLMAYLAARSVEGLPLSFPGTTGVDRPRSGGIFASSDNKSKNPTPSMG